MRSSSESSAEAAISRVRPSVAAPATRSAGETPSADASPSESAINAHADRVDNGRPEDFLIRDLDESELVDHPLRPDPLRGQGAVRDALPDTRGVHPQSLRRFGDTQSGHIQKHIDLARVMYIPLVPLIASCGPRPWTALKSAH